ncbi:MULTISPECIES: hypothetical protein [unclassified Kitasatospora]|uniref:hypothetical protein n=1 Tax=unclassified Kitasatospora TaxID=2633591 RepID=UPI002E35BE3C|nr:hypothetical protein [Kitasatospora sp. NBC_01246]
MSDEVQAHSVGGDDEDLAGCGIQFNASAVDDEVQAHSVGEDDEDLAGCGIQFNASAADGPAGV